jgi:hypothetical protein
MTAENYKDRRRRYSRGRLGTGQPATSPREPEVPVNDVLLLVKSPNLNVMGGLVKDPVTG